MRQIKYKMVIGRKCRLLSLAVWDKARIEYKIGEWVTAPEWLRKEGLSQLDKMVDNINNDEEQKTLIEFQKMVSDLPDDFGLKGSLQRKAMSMRKDIKLQNVMKKVYLIVQRGFLLMAVI